MHLSLMNKTLYMDLFYHRARSEETIPDPHFRVYNGPPGSLGSTWEFFFFLFGCFSFLLLICLFLDQISKCKTKIQDT